MKKDLVQLIKDHPDGIFIIDKDHWEFVEVQPGEGTGTEPITLAMAGEVIELGDGGYGCGPYYGGDILQALAVIVGVKVESV